MVRLIALSILFSGACSLHAQEADRAIRKGNTALEKGDAAAATRAYEQAAKDERGVFNLGNAWYGQDSLARAQQAYESAAAMAKGDQAQARAYHNLGNAQLRQRKFQEAVNAYKEALKRSPTDADTRYNLAFAQKMLEQQQKQKKDEGKDQNKDQDKKKQDEQPKDPQNKEGQDKDKEAQEQPQPKDRIDPQDAKRMLDAAQQQEKNVQDEVRRKLQPKPIAPTDKDW
ncbi:MAG: tetratricopeptide repeat protein [Flavobacteriales bacterium]|nr:tetratricopeptide repeat protein [Flavobacteriales bacterium]